MIQFAYSKEKLIKFMREEVYLKEELSIQRDRPIFIILEKNTTKTVRYIVSVRFGKEIIWQTHGNNSEDIVNSLHLFLIKHGLIKEDKTDKIGSLLQNKTKFLFEDIQKGQCNNTLSINESKKDLQTKKSEPKKDLRTMRKELGEIFQKGFQNEGIDVYSKEEGILFYSSTYNEIIAFDNTIEFWKELIVTYLLVLPERAKDGFKIPELANIIYNSGTSINIYINHFLKQEELESFNPGDEEYPFNLCDCEDYYVNRPSLICWVDNLFWDLGIKEVECFFG